MWPSWANDHIDTQVGVKTLKRTTGINQRAGVQSIILDAAMSQLLSLLGLARGGLWLSSHPASLSHAAVGQDGRPKIELYSSRRK